MRTSEEGKNFIKEQEGLRLTAYKCSAGKWTIGYGHIDGVFEGMQINKEKAEELFESDLRNKAEKHINSLVKVPLTQGQYDALVSFVFNLGVGNFASSTLLKKLNNRDYVGASLQFERWVYCNGKIMQGLLKRRLAEKEIFLS